jgi:hypothetical protein
MIEPVAAVFAANNVIVPIESPPTFAQRLSDFPAVNVSHKTATQQAHDATGALVAEVSQLRGTCYD